MNPKKKILYVITKSNFGGAQRYVYELATGLPKDAYDVAVALGGSGELKTMLEEAGIKTYSIKHFARDIKFIDEIRAAQELKDIIHEWNPDVLHLNSSKAGGTGAFVGRLMGVPRIIFTAHGWPFFESRGILWRTVVWFLSWITALLSHRIILVSEHDRAHMRMPLVARKCSVIRTAVPDFPLHSRESARAALFPLEEIEPHRPDLWVATVAELTPNKNLLTALRAVLLLNRYSPRRVFYVILGEGELRDEITTFIKSRHLEDSVELLGNVPNARSYLKAFDVFLLPSRKEGMPYALLEAGAAGLPVIASRVGGIPEIIENGVSGLLVDPHEYESMVAALRELVGEPKKITTYGAALQSNIKTNFVLTNMRTQTYACYDE